MSFEFDKFGAPEAEQPQAKPANAVDRVLGTIRSAFNKRVDTASDELVRASNGEVSAPRAALRTAGQAAGFITDLGFEAAKAVTPEPVEQAVKKGIEGIAETAPAQEITRRYQDFQQRYPEASKDLEAFLNLSSIIPVGASTRLASKVTEKIAQKAGTVVEARRAARIEASAQELNDTVGKIVQGKKGDISKAAQALRLVDTEGVQTYADLGERLDDKIELLSTQMDDLLDSQKGNFGRDKLATVTEVGDEVVEQRFVDDAISQLKELYTSTKDAPALARVVQLESKLDGEGLTRLEINNLAREYGTEFKSKAFSKTGDPLTTVNAQAYENTRKGIKGVVRNITEGDAPKLIDSQLSVLLRTRPLVKKMEERVNALYQRVQKRGVLERVARGTADAVNLATFNTLSGFISRLLPSNVGLKTLNSIELEKQLSKNLSKVEELLKETSDEKLVSGLKELLQTTPQ